MAEKYCVFRSDLMSGTDVAADLVSCRVYDESGDPIAVENGTIVELSGYESGQHEVMKAKLATPASKLSDCVVIGSAEVMYDERKKNLDEFINEAGSICRGYVLRSRNMFSVTPEGFVNGTVPTVDAEVGIGTGGKIDAAGTGFGVVRAIEMTSRYTYYVIMIANTESTASTGTETA